MKKESEAQAIADAMCEELGEGWEALIHENMGWFARVKKGCVTVHHHSGHMGRPDRYSAWIEPDILIGHTRLQVIENGVSPTEAMGMATQKARTVILRLENAMAELNDVVRTY